jgi:hypothetical protein
MTHLVTCDLETFYSKDFSLSKATTEEYVRSPQFETIGISLKLDDHPTAERMGVGVKGNEVAKAIGMRYKDFSELDLAVYGNYCCNDSDLTKLLFDKYMAMGFPKIELRLLDLTLRMFIDPVLVLDEPMLRKHLTEVQDRKQALMESVRDTMLATADPDYVHAIFSDGMAGIKKLLMSNDKFATLLRSYGVEPPTKISHTTGKVAYAFAKTDEGLKALQESTDERVQTIVAARLGNKSTLEETRTQRFIEMAQRGKFPVPLRYYGAHSGRWSGQDSVNLQNLPSRGENAGRIKKSMLAPPGYVVIDCDSAQIEARTLAWLAGQADLVQAFENKDDVYTIMASQIYGIPQIQVTQGSGSQRQVGKTVVLGAGYGVGHAKLKLFLKTMAGVDVTEDEAKRIINTYRTTYSRIPALWRNAEDALAALANGNGKQVDATGIIHAVPGKGLSLPNGLFIQYPDLRKVFDENGKAKWLYTSKGVTTNIYGGKVVENFTQAVARCVVAEQMLKISQKYKVVLTVHDAVACIAKAEEAAEAKAYVEECMSWRPKWAQGLPLACESGIGASYGDC